MARFTRLKHRNISETKRLPRLGKIRLGIKKKKGNAEYPAEIDYFKFDDHAHVVKLGFGDNPEDLKELEVMLPDESIDKVFPARLAAYKRSGLFCEGDGENGLRRQDDGSWKPCECPCPMLDNGDCKQQAVLNVIIPKISMGGVFQIATGSYTSIVDVQSGIEFVEKLVGRVSWVPLKLERVPNKITHTDPKSKRTHSQTHYTLRLTFPYDIDFVNRLKDDTKRILSGPRYMLPEPEVNPLLDPPDVVEEDDLQSTEATVVDDDQGAPERVEAERVGLPAGTKVQEPPAAPTEPAASEPEPAPAPPAESPKPEATAKVATRNQVGQLWSAVVKAFPDADAATGFFKFFVNDYCGVEKSDQLPAAEFTKLMPKVKRVAAVADATEREQAAQTLAHELKEDYFARKEAEVAEDEAVAAAAEDDVPF